MVKWTAAVIAGGGIADVTQGLTATLRANSTVWTGGLGNLIIATAELGGALLVSFLALAAPAAAIAVVILFLWLAIRLLRRLLRGVRPSIRLRRFGLRKPLKKNVKQFAPSGRTVSYGLKQ